MWPSPYLMCVPCVQRIAECKRELARPFLSSDRKQYLQRSVQGRERMINYNKQDLLAIDKELVKRELALRQLDCKYRDVQPLSTN